MAQWADYCISKITYAGSQIDTAYIYKHTGTHLIEGQSVSGNWLISRAQLGQSLCTVSRNDLNQWIFKESIYQGFGKFNYPRNMPLNTARRKLFISYYHKDDQYYKNAFHSYFSDLFVDKSVNVGDINTDNSAEYISRLINEGYMNDTSVLVVLVGPKTKCRKHVDWEIYGALDYRVGNCYAGLIGLRLPTHPDYGQSIHYLDRYPARLAANVSSDYAILRDWTTDRATMQSYIELANSRRGTYNHLIKNHSIAQMSRNTCE